MDASHSISVLQSEDYLQLQITTSDKSSLSQVQCTVVQGSSQQHMQIHETDKAHQDETNEQRQVAKNKTQMHTHAVKQF